jgi:hypothetical protein
VDGTKYTAGRDFQKKFDVVFDPSALYVAYQCLLVSNDGAHSFTAASPDLTTAKGAPQMPCGKPRPAATPAAPRPLAGTAAATAAAPTAMPGTVPATTSAPATPPAPPTGPPLPEPSINDFSISKVKRGVIWTVSSNGQIFNTLNGGSDRAKTWNNVSNITDAPAHTIFSSIEAGDDANTAYVIGRVASQRGSIVPPDQDTDLPLIWRTVDGGKTWTSIVDGLPKDERTGSWVNSLRADPAQPGLLFAGTETTVYVSFNNGDHWESLRQNLPSTSIRDIDLHTDHHQNDLVIGTYGRGFWVLDDITPLRQIAADAKAIGSSTAYLFAPEEAIRARFNSNWDQPFSIEVPHVRNAPYGAIVDYYLAQQPAGPIELQVSDAQGNVVRTLSSKLPPPIAGEEFPRYWLASPESRALTVHAGLNRFAWDLRYDDPPALRHDLENEMNSVPGATTEGPHGPQAIPGVYTLKLTVDGQVYTRQVTVVNDPRVGQSQELMAALRIQNQLTLLSVKGMEQSFAGHEEVNAVKDQLAALMKGTLPPEVAAQAKTLDASLTRIGGGGGGRRGAPDPNALQSFMDLNNAYNAMVSMMQVGLDIAPTATQISTWESDCDHSKRTAAEWKTVQQQIDDFNTLLKTNQLSELKIAPTTLTDGSCSFTPEGSKSTSAPGKRRSK